MSKSSGNEVNQSAVISKCLLISLLVWLFLSRGYRAYLSEIPLYLRRIKNSTETRGAV
jgi:hypothetical protein